MRFAPIVERELRLLSRRPSTYRLRAFTALGATLIGFGVAFASLSLGGTAALLGHNLFKSMTVLVLVAAVMAGPVLTADCLSEEKRNGTLGLLFLAGLKGRQVVAGKLVALSLPAVYCLVAVFPIMGFSFFVGGVTGGEFARVALVLTETLLFSLASAMAISAVSREGTRALGGSAVLVLFVTVGLPGLALWWGSAGYTADRLALPSPLLGLQQSESAAYEKSAAPFWWAFCANLALSFILLSLASLCVPYSWGDRPVRAPRRAWFPRPFTRKRGNPGASARKRGLLEDDPLIWVAGRKRASSFAVWLLVTVGSVVCLFAAAAPGPSGTPAIAFFAVFYFLHAALKVLIAWDASRRFASDHESGALELLLCSPVEERSIWRGWLVGLKRTYLLPTVALAAVEFVMLVAGMDDTGWWKDEGVWGTAFAAGLALFVADTYAVSWMGVWQGLAARNSMRASLNTLGLVLFAPGAVAFALLGLAGLLGGPSKLPLGLLLLAWFTLSLAADLAACGYAMLKLNDEFRAVAAQASGLGDKYQGWRAERKAAKREAARLRFARLSPRLCENSSVAFDGSGGRPRLP